MKTVKVRIAVAVDSSGEWNAYGGSGGMSDADQMDLCVEPLAQGEARYWLEADLVIPKVPTIQAEVQNA